MPNVAEETLFEDLFMNQPEDPDTSGFMPANFIDELFGFGNPNPMRAGCVSLKELDAIARRELPLTDLRYEHLAFCSPCFREVRAIRQAIDGRPLNPKCIQ